MAKNFKQRPLFAQNLPKEVKKPKIKWKILPIVWGALKKSATVLGFLVLIQLFFVFFIMLPIAQTAKKAVLPEEMVLYLEIDGAFDEVFVSEGFASAFEEPPLTLRETINVLYKAADDDRVQGIVARMKNAQIGFAQAEELRVALEDFKAAEKFAYIYSSSYGEAGGGLASYSLISAFDEIWMQPLGIVSIPGLNAQMPFLRNTLDKIGVEPNFYKRNDYKTAYENLTNSKMSEQNAEMITRLIGDIRENVLSDIPARVDIVREDFASLVDVGLFTASEAKIFGLITHADYADVLIGNVKEQVTGERDFDDDLFVSFEEYAVDVLEPQQKLSKRKPSVALVYAVGAIIQSSEGGFGGGSSVAAAEDIAPAILDASDDERIETIVLRVDSPGGSPTASESILRALQKAQDKGKTVIVSMGETAASGGYWISASADQIFALPNTVTGSIGVVGGKFSAKALFEKLGVNFDGIRWGENAGMWSMTDTFSPNEAERINAMLDAVYEGFVERVSQGRGMTPEQVEEVAGGRVWSGSSAAKVGLVDQLGGLNDALDYAAVELGEENRADINVIVMPEPKSAFEQFLEIVEGQAMLGQVVRENRAILEWAKPVSDAARVMQSPQDFMTYDALRVQ